MVSFWLFLMSSSLSSSSAADVSTTSRRCSHTQVCNKPTGIDCVVLAAVVVVVVVVVKTNTIDIVPLHCYVHIEYTCADRYDNATAHLVEPKVWWAMRNGSAADSINRRTIWSDAFGAVHMSIGSPCDLWAGSQEVCSPDTCSCRYEYVSTRACLRARVRTYVRGISFL